MPIAHCGVMKRTIKMEMKSKPGSSRNTGPWSTMANCQKSFHSARWKRGYNADLVCVSSDLSSRAVKQVLDPIPQHRPITITIWSVLHATTVPFRIRFNLRKADWLSFQQETEDPTSSTHEPMTGWREESLWLNASPAGMTSHGQPGRPSADYEWSRGGAKHSWKHGTTRQKTHAAAEQYRQCPTYWSVTTPPSAAPGTWLNRPHQLWPAPDTGRMTSEIATDSKRRRSYMHWHADWYYGAASVSCL